MSKYFLLFTIALSFTVMGCETMNGAGKDLQKAGAAVQRAAN